jgi:hypothetical protein
MLLETWPAGSGWRGEDTCFPQQDPSLHQPFPNTRSPRHWGHSLPPGTTPAAPAGACCLAAAPALRTHRGQRPRCPAQAPRPPVRRRPLPRRCPPRLQQRRWGRPARPPPPSRPSARLSGRVAGTPSWAWIASPAYGGWWGVGGWVGGWVGGARVKRRGCMRCRQGYQR